MKSIIKGLILSSMFVILSPVMADSTITTTQTTTNSGMWICTTNASGATSGSPEDQADKKMANTAASGSQSFDFALKNCRDCTKITCELQNNSNQ